MAKTESKTQSNKNMTNGLSNELRHQNNKDLVSKLGLEAEDSVRTVTRTTKHGTKVNVSTVTVTKTKRPSQLLRKEKRRKARFERGLTPAA
jgi:hypothetical protein